MNRTSGNKSAIYAGFFWRLWTVVGVLFLAFSVSAHACGFHLQVRNGLRISYPGAVEVGVAVLASRQLGLLPKTPGELTRKKTEFVKVMADLEHLRSRMTAEDVFASAGLQTNGFSVLLVGSALWSSYQIATAGVLARYHIDGPVEGQPVLVTHHAVLRALLSGHITLRRAYEQKLLVHSGADTFVIQRAMETAFRRDLGGTRARH